MNDKVRASLLVLTAWTLSLGCDLFLHAGVLARFYVQDTPFLPPPDVAFRRIPAGYATFLILTVALYGLLDRLEVSGAAGGLRWSAMAGLTTWGALRLGL
jgi:hypothetical protein